MRRCWTRTFLIQVATVVCSGALCAQAPPSANQRQGTNDRRMPAPVHDLSGVWTRSPGERFTKDEPELTAWGQARYKEAKPNTDGQFTLEETNDPVLAGCNPPGVPRIYFHPHPFEFVHTPKYTLMLFEYDHFTRRIYTDGRALPSDPELTWMGTSVGHWEGNTTFVVETSGFNDKTWLDRLGHPHSTELHLTERFRRVDRDHMEVDFTMRDPKALAKPWIATLVFELRPTWELAEVSCSGDYPGFNTIEK